MRHSHLSLLPSQPLSVPPPFPCQFQQRHAGHGGGRASAVAAGAVREGDAAAGEILRETRGLPTKIRSACGVLMLPSGYLT